MSKGEVMGTVQEPSSHVDYFGGPPILTDDKAITVGRLKQYFEENNIPDHTIFVVDGSWLGGRGWVVKEMTANHLSLPERKDGMCLCFWKAWDQEEEEDE